MFYSGSIIVLVVGATEYIILTAGFCSQPFSNK